MTHGDDNEPSRDAKSELRVFREPDFKIEATRQHVDHGAWKGIESLTFSQETQAKMPLACERFCEARHFLELMRRLPPIDESIMQANWYAGAHLAAVIALTEASEAEFDQTHQINPLRHEAYRAAEDLIEEARDPIGINRNYRMLRNARVHESRAVVVLEDRVLEPDIGKPDGPRSRWFFKSISEQERALVCEESRKYSGALAGKRDLVTADELQRFNAYNEKHTMIAVAARHLVILARVIEKAAKTRA